MQIIQNGDALSARQIVTVLNSEGNVVSSEKPCSSKVITEIEPSIVEFAMESWFLFQYIQNSIIHFLKMFYSFICIHSDKKL